MSRPLYCRNEDKFSDHGCYDPLLVTKLINNYRSHPAVLKLPSAVFYHDELKPCAEVRMRESLCQWEKLPNKGFPVIFHGLKVKFIELYTHARVFDLDRANLLAMLKYSLVYCSLLHFKLLHLYYLQY